MEFTQYLSKQPCALVTHTLGVESAILATILAKSVKTPEQTTIVITWNVEEAKASLVHSYDTVPEKVAGSVVVIDNADHAVALIGVERLQQLAKQNKVLILSDMLTGLVAYHLLMEAFPDLLVTTAAFADHGEKIDFQLHATKMVPSQDTVYQAKRAEEIKGKGKQKEAASAKFATSLQYENIVYPAEVQAYLDRKMTDAPSTTQIVKTYQRSLYKQAPKLHDLVMFLTLNRNQRHIIFTRYTGYYGVAILSELLRMEGFEPLVLEGTVDDRRSVMVQFNAQPSKGRVLVTSVLPPVSPKGVAHIHMLDGGFNNTDLLLSSCYKYANYSKLPPTITIHYHVCQRADGTDAGGATLYRVEVTRWEARKKYLAALAKTSIPIVVGPGGKLILTV